MKPTFVFILALIAPIYIPSAQSKPAVSSVPSLQLIKRDQFCVTNGAISTLPNGRLEIDTPSSRAVVQMDTAQTAEIHFRYLGPSKESKPLASGEMRRQIGLKLRAQDTCNLLYTTWHIEPDSKIAVSIKRNVGKHTHEECGAGGYLNIEARRKVEPPKILSGEWHTLRSELHGNDLTIFADGIVVWEGALGNGLSKINGPVGLRTDNARFEFDYYAGRVESKAHSETQNQNVNRCIPTSGD